jgi:hypothetical protein
MKLQISEKQLKLILSNQVESELGEQEAPVDSQPTAGTSSTQSGGQGYPAVGKWESGATRGPGNQIGVTKWSDVVGSTLQRGKGNSLKEQYETIPGRTTELIKSLGGEGKMTHMHNHDFLQIGAFVSDFIPIVGPFISAGLLARDAQLYWQEGKRDEAATTVVWGAIPALQIVKKLKLLEYLPANKFKELGVKLLKGSKNFNTSESEVLKKLSQYKSQIQSELIKHLDMVMGQSKRKTISNVTKKVSGAGATYLGTDYLADKAGKMFKK